MEKEKKLSLLQKNMITQVQDYAITLVDCDGTILSWNKGVEKINGYTEDQILGQNLSVFYLAQDQQFGLPKRLLNLAANEGRAHHIGRRIRKDGTIFWGSIHITAIQDENGQLLGFVNFAREMADGEKI